MVLPGGPVFIVNDESNLLERLGILIKAHKIKQIILISHSDCGYYKISFGNYSEEEILKKLKDFMNDRTSIIISHRISTVKDSDKIFVIDKGEIVEEGNHEELVAKDGIYADLHTKQLLEKELLEMN